MQRPRLRGRGLVAWAGLLCAPAALAQCVINEICYDPAGADAGAEYVELFNAGADTARLDGGRLEFANGADGPVWRAQWTAPPGLRVAPGAIFLIADVGWTQDVTPDAIAELSLQNGPDAVRWSRGDDTHDVVGYGDLGDPSLSEGTPCPDAPAGSVLARRPDGHDTDDNASDFAIADPTPGAFNFPRHAPVLVDLVCEPPSTMAAGDTVVVTIALVNRGTDTLRSTILAFTLGVTTVSVPLADLLPEVTQTTQLRLEPAAMGAVALQAEVRATASSEVWPLRASTYQVGPAWITIDEVMAAPPGGGEWIELHNRDQVPRSLASLALRDEDGAWRELPDLILAPGDRALLVEDLDAFTQWWRERQNDGARLDCGRGFPSDRVATLIGGWPGLNDSPPPDRAFADRVVLADATGAVLDHMTLWGPALQPRRSWERVAAAWAGPLAAGWRPATAPAGCTPACPNSVAQAAPAAAGLEVTPNPFSPTEGSGAAHLRFAVPAAAAGWQLRIYDLWGQSVRDLGGDDFGPGARDVVWDGNDDHGDPLPTGGYVAALRLRTSDGTLVAGGRRLVVLRREGPR